MNEQTVNPELTQNTEAKNFGEADFDDLYRQANDFVNRDRLSVVDARAEVKAAQETEPSVIRTEKEVTEHGIKYVMQVGKIIEHIRALHAPEMR